GQDRERTRSKDASVEATGAGAAWGRDRHCEIWQAGGASRGGERAGEAPGAGQRQGTDKNGGGLRCSTTGGYAEILRV
ncbi:MAG: hypothetical protein AVDCRST_MAG80-1565, partial [uncultured Rubrobacteraceae bacterium]